MLYCDIISYWFGLFASDGVMASLSFEFGVTVAIGNVVEQEKYAWSVLLPFFSLSDLCLDLKGERQCCNCCHFQIFSFWFRRTEQNVHQLAK